MATQKSKIKFDTEAFVFETSLDDIQSSIDRLWQQEDDPLAEPLTKDEVYYLGWWTLNMPLFRKYNQKTALTSAKESAILKLYTKTKKRKK